MPATSKLLLSSGFLRGEPASCDLPSRRPLGPKYQDGEAVEGPLAGFVPAVRPSLPVHPIFVPKPLALKAYSEAPTGLWTRYGRWNREGTRVYNLRGKLIYELP